MADYLVLDAQAVGRHMDALLAAYPDLAEDEALRADMIEGETALNKVIERALDHKLEADQMVHAIALRSDDLQERQARYQSRSDAMRSLIKGLMEQANLPTISLPEATISLTKGRATVVITNVADLPQGYVTFEPKPDRRSLLQALQRGEDIPGAQMATGEPGLTVRTK